ncbi:hypothetical protein St703_18760 [Sporolactobacillus terrae]|uniref:HNH endonuclease n=1 Tax=Sporolactobacillus terrae TaxID=269673 RepID=A0A5K7WWV8_9BACL|nr:hypothetical protein St703_18760 [Sporolactobacillus terrae]
MTKNFYTTSRWKHKRKRMLRRDSYLCQECKRYGKSTEAQMVHHCYPYEDYPQYKLDDWNLASMCNGHGDAMHDRNTGKLTPLGMYWKERATRRRENDTESR